MNKAASPGGGKTLYDANREFYSLLRYGVNVRPEAVEQHQTVFLVDWEQVDRNDFAMVEEVTVNGVHIKRPDIVFYVNGIALGVLELKRSTVSVAEGIRQGPGAGDTWFGRGGGKVGPDIPPGVDSSTETGV